MPLAWYLHLNKKKKKKTVGVKQAFSHYNTAEPVVEKSVIL